MKRKSVYASMTASDLARITRERGLDKPPVVTLSEWADVLEADDVKRQQQGQAAADDGDRDTEDPAADDQPTRATGKKGAK